ncbi:MAG TPA: hypothetical protein VFU88_22415 [Ktedonobacterales bacterium]|nr:hypothetical protein [Ktedonobacterales bacterium]
MPTYTGQREQELARRVRRMLIEQSAILAEESPDEFAWLSKHYPEEQRFFEEELGALIELRLGRWARAYWPMAPRQRELCIADVFELTTRKQTAYACLIRAYRSVRLLEAGESANTFRFADLFRYVAEDGQRQSPWLSFDEGVINDALATRGEADAGDDEELLEIAAENAKGRGRKKAAANGEAAAATATASRPRKTSAAPQRLGAAQRVRANQRAFYQAFAAFERLRLLRRIGADDRQRADERYKLDDRDYSGIYEFTDLIDRFLPPAGLVVHDELNPDGGTA